MLAIKLIMRTIVSSRIDIPGIDMTIPTSEIQGSNALSEALLHAIKFGNAVVCERLLNIGADANFSDSGHRLCCTALLSALQVKQPEIAEMLILRGASNKTQTCDTPIIGESASPRGYSPLHYAAALGFERVLELLLQKYSEPFGTEAVTPLHLAAANGHLACAKMLIEHDKKSTATRSCECNIGNDQHYLNSVIRRTRPTHSWRLTEVSMFPKNCGGTALHQAVAGCHEALVAYLIKTGIEIDLMDENGYTALHAAVRWGYAIITRILIQSGANINCRAFSSWTPLHRAVYEGHTPVLLELFRSQADLTLRDCKGSNAMGLALRHSNSDTVSFLMGLGQKLPKPELLGCSPLCLSLSRHFSGLALLLLDLFRDYSFDCSYHGSLLITAFTNHHLTATRRLLHRLKERRRLSMTMQLVPQLSSALCLFSSYGRVNLMKDILEAGADIDGFSKAQDTPLGIACQMGQLNAVKFLIQRGAKTSWTDQNGRNVSAISKAKGHQHVLNWLQNEGSWSTTIPKIAEDKDLSLLGARTLVSYVENHHCDSAIYDSKPFGKFGIRRRSSFSLEYILRLQNQTAVSSSKSPGRTRGKHIWDSKESRAQHFWTYCFAICKKRDILLPFRYSSYPLSQCILRLAYDKPWEIF